jgi:uncharacterized coiled-coil protein SlyX
MIGLIVFAILATAAFGGLIFQMTRVGDLQTRLSTADGRLRQYGDPPPAYTDEATRQNGEVFSLLSADLQKLSALVGNESGALPEPLITEVRSMLSQVGEARKGLVDDQSSLVSAIRAFNQRVAELEESMANQETTNRELGGQVDSLTAQLKSVRDEFEQQIAAQGEQVRLAEEDKAQQLAAKDGQLGELQKTLDAREQQLNQLKREGLRREQDLELEVARLQRQVDSLQSTIKQIKSITFDANAILRQADGRVERAIPGSDVVYVNIGERDRAKVGMTFQVFSQSITQMRDELEGKASIEIVTLMESTAECRVTRQTPGQPIVEGDIIVNIAYDKARKPKFVVVGDFDINYDGIVDADGVERIEAIVRDWGGQVVRELDETTDYVVVGVGPQSPEFAEGTIVSDVVRDLAMEKRWERAQFASMIEKARTMYIPVITQNQFLFLTGYAGDAAEIAGR